MAAPVYDRRPRRPRSVTVLGWGVLLLGVANIWRAVGLLRQGGLLQQLEVSPDPRLRAGLATLWAVLFLAAAVAIWRRWRPARPGVPALLAIYGLYSVALPAMYGRDGSSGNDLALAAAGYGLTVAYAFWALNRAPARAHFDRPGAGS